MTSILLESTLRLTPHLSTRPPHDGASGGGGHRPRVPASANPLTLTNKQISAY
jgi:hypothetical protein